MRAKVTLTIAHAGLTKATVLDANGNAVGQAGLTRTGRQVQLAFPADTMHVVLQ